MLHEFDIEVPEGMPIYLQESLYEKLCAEHYTKGAPLGEVLTSGRAIVSEFTARFPVLSLTKEQIVIEEFIPPPRYPDGTIVFVEKYGKFAGYYNACKVSQASTVEQVQKFMTKKFGLTEFNVIK